MPVSAAAAVIARSSATEFRRRGAFDHPEPDLAAGFVRRRGCGDPSGARHLARGRVDRAVQTGDLLALTNELVRPFECRGGDAPGARRERRPNPRRGDVPAAAAVPGLRPPGILNGITALTATTGGGLDAIVGDLEQIAAALAPVAGGGEPILIVSPAQAAALAQLPGDAAV